MNRNLAVLISYSPLQKRSDRLRGKRAEFMISLIDIQNASRIIKQKVIRTPLIYSASFSKMCDAEVYLKLENLQQTGSFKLRGAACKIDSLVNQSDGCTGVVAASAGNHAQGVALAAKRAGLPATIVMPESASISKQEATRAYGGEVILHGQSIVECIEKAQKLAQNGNVFIHPFDDPDIICGQGTIGLEILEDLPDTDAIFVPIGGGGLMAGVSMAVKSVRPEVQLIGVQAAACPSAFQALQEGKVTCVESVKSIADGISVKQIGQLPFEIIHSLVNQIVLVEEDQIAASILLLLERRKVLAEGAGAVPLAALLSGKSDFPKGGKIVLVISGGNVDSPLLDRIIRQGLVWNGRIMRFSVCLEDVPGALMEILKIIAFLKANVLHIYHERSCWDIPIHLSHVELELETRGPQHILEISKTLEESGYRLCNLS